MSSLKIVGVHGIGKYHYFAEAGGSAGRAAEAMRAKWNAYLHKGLAVRTPYAGQQYFSEIAYYAHFLRTGPVRPVKQMDAPSKLVFADWVRQLDGRVPRAAGESLTHLMHIVAAWLLDKLGPEAVRFAEDFCPEVATYLGGGAPRLKARDAVADVIRRRAPQIVIAHSLGSVVAYEAFWAHADVRTDLLITLGSPLAMSNVVFERLAPLPVNGLGAKPPNVRRWINIADKDDLAAIPPALRDRFRGVERDIACNIDKLDFHTVRNYLGCAAVTDCL